ncbi:MAG: flagellar hook basal-body protein [Planctomycetes bacterium]|nr:flagellar hook basal-body protein [Planctomycetota bacterium]
MSSPGIYSSAAAMQAHRVRQESVAHNLANAQTPGFKRILVSERLFAEDLAQAQAGLPVAEPVLDLSQGHLRHTGRSLDFAIDGPGFFVVRAPDGPRYARAGNFQLDAEGHLVTTSGWRVQGGDGDLRIGTGPSDGLRIDGRDLLLLPGGGQIRIKLVDFAPGEIEPSGDGTFRARAGSNPLLSGAQVRQGALELGNSAPVEELIELIDIQRSFEAASRSIATILRVEERLTSELR